MSTKRTYGKRSDSALALWVKLARAYSVFNRESAHDIRRYGLTQPQFGALECLYHLGPMTIGDLSRKMLVSGGNMTCVIDNLEKEGHVRRVQSEVDRRSVTVELTPQGQELIGRIFPQHAALIENVASVLDANEQDELSRLLKKLGSGISV
ncbi:MAG: MarR family transcriptional regulator [Bacteroidetes bacterium]|nr:MarR family transcriptional regulator [Bacteroidota bacterium]